MRTQTTHIIQRQTFLFNTVKHYSAYELQDKISRYCRHQLQDTLEKLFDQAVNDNVFIRIDKLEINVGSVSIKRLDEELTRKISDGIEKRLNEIINRAGQVDDLFVEQYTREEMLAQQFWFFLYNGYLPSWANTNFPDDISDWLLTTAPERLREEVINAIKEKPAIAGRLISHFSDTILSKLFHIDSIKASPDELIKLLTVVHNYTPLSLTKIREKYWLTVLEASQIKSISLDNFLSVFYKAIQPLLIKKEKENQADEYLFFRTLKQHIEERPLETSSSWKQQLMDALQTILSKLEVSNQNDNSEPELTGKPDNVIKREGSTEQKHLNGDVTENNTSAISESEDVFIETDNYVVTSNKRFPDKQKGGKKLSEDNAIYVDYAGIILLHPFLNVLYTEMELLKEKEWVSVDAQQKAVQVLACLAQEEDFCPEYKMPLLKILCGLHIEEVVSPDIVLTGRDKALIEELLLAIIKHWSAAGNMSIAGLRETFLQHDGKLITVDKGWKLTVERKTIDILIGKLPWGVSFVKLPWLNQMLFVDWV